jgi:hypothetical protein
MPPHSVQEAQGLGKLLCGSCRHEIVMVRRLDFSIFGSASSSMPSFIEALPWIRQLPPGSANVREKAPCEISQR